MVSPAIVSLGHRESREDGQHDPTHDHRGDHDHNLTVRPTLNSRVATTCLDGASNSGKLCFNAIIIGIGLLTPGEIAFLYPPLRLPGIERPVRIRASPRC